MNSNNSFLVKICGMRDLNNIQEIAALNPDLMGFIFYKKSPRYVGENFKVPQNFPSTIKKVGVFVNESMEVVKQMIETHKLDYVQLHGEESVEYCKTLKSKVVGIIKVFSIDKDFNFKTVTPYESVADYFLFDTKGKFYGGNSVTFDWKLIANYNQKIPFLLSGGLSESNLNEISKLTQFNLAGVDLNSGLEDSPGFKSSIKVKSALDIINKVFRT